MIRICWNFVQPLLERPLCRRGGDLQKQKSTLKRKNDTRLVSILTSLYFKSFNKLLVLPNTTINFGPSTQREQHVFLCDMIHWKHLPICGEEIELLH
jgi:hypothetical protein